MVENLHLDLGDQGGFGGVGEAGVCLQTMARLMRRLGEIRDHVKADGINVEKYVKELTVVTIDLVKACGMMFEQEPLRFIAMITAAGGTGSHGAKRDCS